MTNQINIIVHHNNRKMKLENHTGIKLQLKDGSSVLPYTKSNDIYLSEIERVLKDNDISYKIVGNVVIGGTPKALVQTDVGKEEIKLLVDEVKGLIAERKAYIKKNGLGDSEFFKGEINALQNANKDLAIKQDGGQGDMTKQDLEKTISKAKKYFLMYRELKG